LGTRFLNRHDVRDRDEAIDCCACLSTHADRPPESRRSAGKPRQRAAQPARRSEQLADLTTRSQRPTAVPQHTRSPSAGRPEVLQPSARCSLSGSGAAGRQRPHNGTGLNGRRSRVHGDPDAVRLLAAERWLEEAIRAGTSAVPCAGTKGVELLPLLAWRGVARTDQLELLSHMRHR